MKHRYCEHCLVVPISNQQKYCDACTEELTTWLYAAEEKRLDDVEEQQYIAELEHKQLSFHYES